MFMWRRRFPWLDTAALWSCKRPRQRLCLRGAPRGAVCSKIGYHGPSSQDHDDFASVGACGRRCGGLFEVKGTISHPSPAPRGMKWQERRIIPAQSAAHGGANHLNVLRDMQIEIGLLAIFALPKGFSVRFGLGDGDEKNFDHCIGRAANVSRRGACLCMGILDDRRVRIPLQLFRSHGKF